MLVDEIWRYPVKSMGGERVDAVDVDEHGIRGDRAWGLFDPATAMVLTARREPALLFLSARLVDGRPVITCDAGRELADDDALSAWMGRPVVLRPASAGPATFENPLDAEHETDWVSWQSTGGTYHDGGSKISFVSRRELGDWDPRRFRINLILAGADGDPPAGEVAVGTATLRVRRPIDRCVMVTRAQPGLPADRSLLGRLIRERGNRLGTGATVATPGTIAVGDRFG